MGANKWTIYLLHDPQLRPLGYVGQTRLEPPQRLQQHLSTSRRRDSRVCRWLRHLSKRGLTPCITVLEECHSATDAVRAERYWIRVAYDRVGIRLLNTAKGGEGASYDYDSLAHRRLLSRALMKPEILARLRAATKARWQRPDYREMTIRAMREALSRPEVRRRKAAAKKRHWRDPSYREMMSARFRQLWADPQWRASAVRAISEGAKRRPAVTASTKRKLSVRGKERFTKPEERKAVSRRSRRAWRNDEMRKRHREAVTVALSKPVARERMSKAAKLAWTRSDRRREAARQSRRNWANPRVRARIRRGISEAIKRCWADPEWRARRLDQMRLARERAG